MIEITYRGHYHAIVADNAAADTWIARQVAQGHDRADYAYGVPRPLVLRHHGEIVETFALEAQEKAQAFMEERIAEEEQTVHRGILHHLGPAARWWTLEVG